jgi:hypothetical protein
VKFREGNLECSPKTETGKMVTVLDKENTYHKRKRRPEYGTELKSAAVRGLAHPVAKNATRMGHPLLSEPVSGEVPLCPDC